MSLPPHFIDEKKKEVVFHLKGTFPVQLVIPTWMQSFPEYYYASKVANPSSLEHL